MPALDLALRGLGSLYATGLLTRGLTLRDSPLYFNLLPVLPLRKSGRNATRNPTSTSKSETFYCFVHNRSAQNRNHKGKSWAFQVRPGSLEEFAHLVHKVQLLHQTILFQKRALDDQDNVLHSSVTLRKEVY